MGRVFLILLFIIFFGSYTAQLFVARDTISVIENGNNLKMPWANGINFSNFSNIDLNLDGRKDIVAFDKLNLFGVGRFRCFINTGVLLAGETTYTANPSLSYYFPAAANWAIFKDYDCDTKEDLFCSTSAGIMVYKNTSTPSTISFSLMSSLLYSDFQGSNNNLYAASNGVPAISDIDGDQDLDILTFSPGGVLVEYHKNLSKENYGDCTHLEFQLVTYCWGKIIENSCGIDMNQTCAFKPVAGNNINANNNKRHSGSCLTCIDTDGDGDQDLVMGDIGCPGGNILYAHNGGSASNALITGTTGVYPNYPNIGNTTQIKFNNFSCAYSLDVDGDNKNDLIATPNVPGSENYQSVWYYKNTSATSTVNFQFVKKNLFQDEMIEVGQNSFPVLFDYNADGLKDLLVGTYGYYVGNSLQARLTLYKNTGTAAQPSFSLITRDYAGMGTYSLNTIIPTVGDIDGDFDTDLILGTQSGQIYWLKNTAGPGATCSFSFMPAALFTTTYAAAAPQLFDIDNDLDLDLMIGGKNGKIQYYQNIGTVNSASFTLANAFFGSVSTLGNPSLFASDGYAAPFFYNEGGSTKLLAGSISGQIFYYSVPSSTAACVLISANANGLSEGGQSTVFFEDINADSKRDLFMGNAAGGLSFFSSMGPDVAIKEFNENETGYITVYPNPAAHSVNIRIDHVEVNNGKLVLTDVLGKEILTKRIRSNFESLDISELNPGIYFVKITVGDLKRTVSITKKIIKQ